ncbi:MAG: hypothetical protein J7497_16900 [Chitinophagaceae bacterium]|nr:hypothetical protein [Chitinophagaceae bacterium]
MRLLDFWKKIWKTPAKDWFYSQIPSNQTPNEIASTTLQPGNIYINVHLKSMRIVNVRNGFKTFYPAVHSFISLKYIGNNNAEFNTVTAPTELAELDAKNIDKIISLNKRLLGPVPYRGGDLQMDIGLFAVQSGDLAKSFLSLLTDMSSIAGVSFIGSVLPFVDPISKGVDLLVGNTSETQLEIGISTDLNKITAGYYAVIAEDKSKVHMNELFIDKKDYKLVDSGGNTVHNYSYIVFAISGTDKKEDWFDIPELASSYKKLQDDIKGGDINAATQSLDFFKRIVLTSNDLLFKDAKEIVKQVTEEVNDILQNTQVADSNTSSLRNLNEFPIYSN